MSIRFTKRSGGAGRRERSIRTEASDASRTPEDVAVAAVLLQRLPLFSGCTTEELERLAKSAYPATFHPGDRLCVAGAEAPEAYIVVDGEAAVTVGDITVDTIGPADIVGERGPITGRPRAATVTASTTTRAYAIPREEIRSIVETSPVAATVMRDELLRRYG